MKSTTTTSSTAPLWATLYSRFFWAPIELKSFLVFSTIMTISQLVATYHSGLEAIKGAILPITGWSMANAYMSVIFFIYALVFSAGPAGQRIWYRLAIIGIVTLHVFYGVKGISSYDDNDYGNPYLIISQWRPVWTIVLPIFWIVLLMSKRVTVFCKAQN